jgi:phosphohistidine phosphatase
MNKKLVVVRHAKSSWSDYSLSDINRPLNKRGERDAPNMAKKVKDIGIDIEYLITSPALRAKNTCEIFAKSFSREESVEVFNHLYHGDISDLIETINLIDESINCAAIFAHNPGLTSFANMISSSIIENVPTCGALIINVDQKKWQDVTLKSLTLDKFIYPKMYL